MKAAKAHKRISQAQDLISDVLERYSDDAPDERRRQGNTAGHNGITKSKVTARQSV